MLTVSSTLATVLLVFTISWSESLDVGEKIRRLIPFDRSETQNCTEQRPHLARAEYSPDGVTPQRCLSIQEIFPLARHRHLRVYTPTVQIETVDITSHHPIHAYRYLQGRWFDVSRRFLTPSSRRFRLRHSRTLNSNSLFALRVAHTATYYLVKVLWSPVELHPYTTRCVPSTPLISRTMTTLPSTAAMHPTTSYIIVTRARPTQVQTSRPYVTQHRTSTDVAPTPSRTIQSTSLASPTSPWTTSRMHPTSSALTTSSTTPGTHRPRTVIAIVSSAVGIVASSLIAYLWRRLRARKMSVTAVTMNELNMDDDATPETASNRASSIIYLNYVNPTFVEENLADQSSLLARTDTDQQ